MSFIKGIKIFFKTGNIILNILLKYSRWRPLPFPNQSLLCWHSPWVMSSSIANPLYEKILMFPLLFLYSLKLQKSEEQHKLLQFLFLIYLPSPSSAQAKAAKKAITTINSFIPAFIGEELSRRQGKLITCNLVFLYNCNLSWLWNLFKYIWNMLLFSLKIN